MEHLSKTQRAAAKAWEELNDDRALALQVARRLRSKANATVSEREQASTLTMQVILSYRMDDLMMVLQHAVEQAQVPWYRRTGFVPGLLTGLGIAAAVVALGLELSRHGLGQ